MTRYAIDPERAALLAVWPGGTGDLAATVATMPKAADDEQALAVARTMTHLADVAWRTYTHPASAADSLEVNTEGWRRGLERDAFAGVLDAVRAPHLPEHGTLMQSYAAVTECAHRVGRALHAVGDAALTDAAAREIERELDAVERAERGDLTGRASQAVTLTRASASPVQVVQADRLLREFPFGDARLFTEVEPAAAAVAAAHWLQAAADVAAQASGSDPTTVVTEADDIEALAHQTPTLVLELMAEGATPRQVVSDLIADAMLAARGLVPDPVAVADAVEDAEAQVELPQDVDLAQALAGAIRTTPLDPARPALDLLEDLLAGIHGCWLIYDETTVDDADVDEDLADEETAEPGSDSTAFVDAVRAQAAKDAERLA